MLTCVGAERCRRVTNHATHDIGQFNRVTADIEQHLLGALATTEAPDAAALMDQKTFNFFVHCGVV